MPLSCMADSTLAQRRLGRESGNGELTLENPLMSSVRYIDEPPTTTGVKPRCFIEDIAVDACRTKSPATKRITRTCARMHTCTHTPTHARVHPPVRPGGTRRHGRHGIRVRHDDHGARAHGRGGGVGSGGRGVCLRLVGKVISPHEARWSRWLQQRKVHLARCLGALRKWLGGTRDEGRGCWQGQQKRESRDVHQLSRSCTLKYKSTYM